MSKTNKSKTNKSKTNKSKTNKSKTSKSKKNLDSSDEYDLCQLSIVKSNKKNIDEDFDKKAEIIMEKLRQNYLEQKKLINDFRELKATHKKEIKCINKSNSRSNSGKHTGFNKPEPVPPSLKSLLKIKDDKLPRSKITNLIYQYFTDNNMYNTKTKKEIIPNSKIRKIFGMKDDDVMNFYNLQTWLKKVYNESNLNNSNTIEV
ncbi:SWIB/MDM2 domain-containing protein [Acanthamoeba polyphaga moumouvirus]|uniref:SWIB/MDM2 domain-containing protein n=2 Tax=Moumouvirus TaxID=3080801 RepID=L7RBH0_9VIRU|nr:SWIB/MDM2 domain-containing protein [Acanthamoeba polyphaga moumouvirus]AGC01834.1 SWIB/MDM2 domain-containing protein [Acanthamoeba polyphaga moumouvirus]AQN68191.1 SWIB/MDM2 domain protein [Saudi moumouvirus]